MAIPPSLVFWLEMKKPRPNGGARTGSRCGLGSDFDLRLHSSIGICRRDGAVDVQKVAHRTAPHVAERERHRHDQEQ